MAAKIRKIRQSNTDVRSSQNFVDSTPSATNPTHKAIRHIGCEIEGRLGKEKNYDSGCEWVLSQAIAWEVPRSNKSTSMLIVVGCTLSYVFVARSGD